MQSTIFKPVSPRKKQVTVTLQPETIDLCSQLVGEGLAKNRSDVIDRLAQYFIEHSGYSADE